MRLLVAPLGRPHRPLLVADDEPPQQGDERELQQEDGEEHPERLDALVVGEHRGDDEQEAPEDGEGDARDDDREHPRHPHPPRRRVEEALQHALIIPPPGASGNPGRGRRGPDDPLVLSPRHDRDPPRRQPAGVARRSHGPRRRGRHRPRAGQGGGRRAGGRRGPRPGAAARRRRRHRDRHAQERRRLPLRDAPLGRPRHGRGRPVGRARDHAGLRPADRRRLLLRLRPAAAAHRGGLPGDRGRDGTPDRRRVALPAHRDEHRGRPRVLRRARRGLQG